jgi:hypothetical protein
MIKLETKFSSTIVIQDVLLPNTWFIDIRLVANSNVNQKNYNIALDRIEFYVNEILDNSILLSPKSGELFNQPSGLNGCVHMLPDEPYDHLIGIVLYTKLNSILEKVFFVESIAVNSYQGDNITHTYESSDGDMGTLRTIIDDPTLKEYIDYWYETSVSYFKLDFNGLQRITEKWDDLGFPYEGNNDSTVIPLRDFKPRIVPHDDDDRPTIA